MKCLNCGKEAGKNKGGIPKDYCTKDCAIVVARQGKKTVKKPKYCLICGRSTGACTCAYS